MPNEWFQEFILKTIDQRQQDKAVISPDGAGKQPKAKRKRTTETASPLNDLPVAPAASTSASISTSAPMPMPSRNSPSVTSLLSSTFQQPYLGGMSNHFRKPDYIPSDLSLPTSDPLPPATYAAAYAPPPPPMPPMRSMPMELDVRSHEAQAYSSIRDNFNTILQNPDGTPETDKSLMDLFSTVRRFSLPPFAGV
jgi:hypothetical protein